MFLQVSVILFTGGGCLPLGGVADTNLGRHPLGYRHPPGQTPPAQCILGYTPPCPVYVGIHILPAQCMLEYPPSSGHPSSHWSRRYASYWNALLLQDKVGCRLIWSFCRSAYSFELVSSMPQTSLWGVICHEQGQLLPVQANSTVPNENKVMYLSLLFPVNFLPISCKYHFIIGSCEWY